MSWKSDSLPNKQIIRRFSNQQFVPKPSRVHRVLLQSISLGFRVRFPLRTFSLPQAIISPEMSPVQFVQDFNKHFLRGCF